MVQGHGVARILATGISTEIGRIGEALQTVETEETLHQRALWWVLGGALFLLGMVLYVPFMQRLFHFQMLHPLDLVICLLAGIMSVIWVEGLKLVRRHRMPAL